VILISVMSNLFEYSYVNVKPVEISRNLSALHIVIGVFGRI